MNAKTGLPKKPKRHLKPAEMANGKLRCLGGIFAIDNGWEKTALLPEAERSIQKSFPAKVQPNVHQIRQVFTSEVDDDAVKRDKFDFRCDDDSSSDSDGAAKEKSGGNKSESEDAEASVEGQKSTAETSLKLLKTRLEAEVRAKKAAAKRSHEEDGTLMSTNESAQVDDDTISLLASDDDLK